MLYALLAKRYTPIRKDFYAAIIQISEELDRRLDEAAERFGQSKTELIAEAIRLRFEEIEDLAEAEERLKDIGERTSLKDLAIEFGLTDLFDKPGHS